MSHRISTKPYIIGFGLSVLLTAEAFFLTINHSLSTQTIITIVLGLAIVQLLVQLLFFLHLDRIGKAPWNILVFVFTAIVVATVIFGSIWIMDHLRYGHQVSPEDAAQYLKKDEGY